MGAIAGGVAAAAAGSLVSGGMSALTGGSKGSTSSGTSSSAPWSAQQPYMTYGLDQAKDIYNQRQNNPMPAGSWTAPENGMQQSAVGNLYNVGDASYSQFAPWTGAGQTLAGAATPYLNNANSMATNGIGSSDPAISQLMKQYAMTGAMPGTSSVNSGLTSGVTNAAQQGLGSLAQGQSLANQVGAQALNPNAGMNATIQGATDYANNAGLNGQIDAASRDVTRQLGEDTVRGIHQGTMTSGNANSSRAASLEGIADRGAADRIADISSQMRGAAYNQGGLLASNQYTTGLNTALGASSALNTNGGLAGSLASNELNRETGQNQFDTTSRLGSAATSNNSDLGWATNNAQTQLSANGQLGQGLGYGISASNAGLNGSLTGLQAALAAGGYQQAQDQNQINGNLAQWSANDQRNQSLLNDYWGIVGKPLGTSGTTSSTPAAGNPLQSALGGGLSGYGMWQNAGSPSLSNLFGSGGSTVAPATVGGSFGTDYF